ncbi:MAG: hypothetical protein KAH04_01945, partial [Psychrilyobacter sp.]|nr:hypothetical protein [Psychrilyobacter sp.]
MNNIKRIYKKRDFKPRKILNEDTKNEIIRYHENGKTRSIENFKEDKKNGIFKYYTEDGLDIKHEKYVNNEKIEIVLFHNNGKLRAKES